MRFTSALLGAAVTIGSTDAFLGLHRRHTQVNVNCGSACNTGAQACNQSFRSGCQAPMPPMPVAPMIQAPMMPAAPACGATCPPKQVVVQEVHRRPRTINHVEYKPVVTQHTVEEQVVVNKVVNIPQQPICQPVCPSATPSCVPCGSNNGMNNFGAINAPIMPAPIMPAGGLVANTTL